MDRLNKSTSANCADKRKKQSSRFSAMCFFILLHCAFVAKADEWNFEASGTFDVSSDKTFAGSVDVGNNTLTLNVINSVVFLRNYQTNTPSMFQISNGGKLVINGEDGKVVTFNGNFDIDDVYTNGLPDSYSGPRSGAAIYMTGTSTVELHYVDFTNFLCNRRNGGNHAGVINFFNSDNNNNGSATFDHINFYNCYAGIPRPTEPSGDNDNKWGRIINIQSGTWNITMTNSSIRHCYINEPYSSNTDINGMGGAIRSQGNVGGILRLTDCAFEDNLYYDRYTGKLAGQGGAINWRSGNNTGSNPAHLIIKDCRFVRNKAKQGGAIATNAKITIERNTTDATKYTYISKNEAVEGGGIYFWTYNGGQASYDGEGFDAILGDANANSDYLRIYDNYARDFGGGVYITIDPSNDIGFNSENQPISPNFYVRFYKGCRVAYNRSPKGAGVAIIDNAGNKHYNGAGQTPANTWSGVYNRHIYFDGSKVENNKTLLKNGETVPSEVAGGGIYISKQRSPDGSFSNDFDNPTNGGGGLLTVDLVSGTCSGNNAVAGTFVFNDHINDDQGLPFDDSETGTSPGYGGGYYIASLFEGTVNSTLNVNIGEAGKTLEMYNNQAYTDGGGVYVLYDREDERQNEGTVTVKGGTIGKIDKTVPQNPVLCPNKALNGNGGGICVMSGTVVVENGHVDYNTANQNGGGIYLNDGDLTFKGGNVDQNEASNSNGGGICVMSGAVSVENGHVDHNTANQKGGGIYLNGGDLTFKGGSVDSNEASNNDGGGICVEGGNIVVSGGTVSNNEAKLKNGGGISVLGGTVLVEGGNILTNTANELGGGVYVSVQDATIITKIRGGANISSNSAKGGGGVYVDKGILKLEGPDFAPGAYGKTEAEADDTHTRLTNNKATDGNGGGINAGNGEVDLTNTLIFKNKASGMGDNKGRGGGVYLNTGTIKLTTSKILFDTAYLNGGGIDDHLGSIFITGGDISNNTAINGGGGGVYTHDGDITVWPDYDIENTAITSQQIETQVMPKGTKVTGNKAGKNGGGLNTHTGRFDVRFATITDNEAGMSYGPTGNGGGTGGNGGGLFCEGPHTDPSGYTVRLLHCHLNDNKAYGNSNNDNDLTGRGGGIYLKLGSIFAEYCDILRNEADINGGGLDNHEGELRVYGSYIDHNKAKTGKGGGIYTEEGNIVVGPCDSYGYTSSKASRIYNNTAYINGGGINNHKGDITIHGDRINNNTAVTGDGGGVYINSGKINMYGGQINNNKADNGKGGGVYGGAGEFNIMEREAHPILEILEVENVTNNSFTVHFHHVDRGLAMESGATNKEFGIAFSKNSYPTDLGENVDWTGHWQGVSTIKAFSATGTPVPSSPHTYIQNEGCSRFVINSTTANTTIDPNTVYYVVAYGKYSKGGKNYFDASPAIAVKTYGNNPVVVTGVAFGITTNSASVNGKLFYEGVGTQLKKGIEISSDYGETWVKHQAQSVGNVFSVTISGLASSKIYKARAYATCQSEEGYQYESQDAEIITFFTLGNSPVVATGEASVTTNSVTVAGELLYEGDNDAVVVTKGIIYNRIGEGEWTNEDADDEFSVTWTGLEPGTYQAQAYATNNLGHTGYGKIITFTIATGSKAPQGPRSVYPAVEENPFFMELTPLQQAMLANTPEGDTTAAPARKGRDDEGPENIPEINKNTARYGGGICIDKKGAELVFSGRRGDVQEGDKLGQINENYASEAGGGIYIGYQTEGENIGPAMMQMMGKCEVNYNHVPASKQGGGIYLDGRLYVGDKKDDLVTVHGLRVDRNFSSDIDQDTWVSYTWNASLTPDNSKLNNVFLPRYDYDYTANQSAANDDKVSVITLLSDISGYRWVDLNENHKEDPDEKFPYSHIGFSVIKGFCPVIAISDDFGNDYLNTTSESTDNIIPGAYANKDYEEWLYSLMVLAGAGEEGTVDVLKGAVFEDSESYVAVHTRSNRFAPFLSKFIYLWGCWTHPVVRVDPEKNNPMRGLSESGTEEGWLHHYIIRNPGDNVENVENVEGNKEPLVWEIYSPEGLSWFTSYVNGLNVFDESEGGGDAVHFKWNEDKNPYAIAYIMNDLDMKQYLWVPIGSVKKFYNVASNGGSLFVDSESEDLEGYSNNAHYYRGKFDGQGHIIKGLQGLYLTGIKKYGLFGYLADGAEVKNVFVDDGVFVSDDRNVTYSAGGIAGTLKGGTISNCEARMNFNVTSCEVNTCVGGLVGKMEGTNNAPAIIHSSMAMPEIVGTAGYMGGLVGQVGTNSKLLNSFANPYFPNATTSPYYDIYGSGAFIGGLVGDNQGIVENCYTRLRGNEPTYDGTHSVFGWFAGTNSVEAKDDEMGGIRFCYAPAPANPTDYVKSIAYPNIINGSFGIEVVNPDPGIEEPFGSGNYSETERVSGKYGFKHRDHNIEATNDYVNNDTLIGGLQRALNAWVKDAENNGWNATTGANDNGYAVWTRTMASTINDDYPVLMLGDFNCVGSKDKIYLLYEDDVNHLWNPTTTTSGVTTPGKDFKACNVAGSVATMYMYDAQPLVNVSSDPESPVLKPCDVTISGNTNVPLYIHEDVGITQEDDKLLTARVGVTIKDDNWHLFSSALSGIPIGIKYQTEEAIPRDEECGDEDDPYAVTKNTYTNRNKFDPIAKTLFYQKDNPDVNSYYPAGIGYFPTDTPYGTWRPDDGGQTATDEDVGGYFDLYDYSESYYHWVNYKRNDNDHWHMDEDKKSYHQKFAVDYVNDRVMVHGKGYLMALSEASMMMADGVLNNSDKTLTLSKSDNGANFQTGSNAQPNNGYTAIWRGIHLLGNPYQSYLDFNAQSFGKANGKVFNTYAIVDESLPGRDHYIYYTKNQSRNAPLYADGYIHPHQGFFVKVEGPQPQTFEFTTDMRIAGTSAEYGEFRDNVDYPLVNLLCFDEDGERDLTTVEVNRPEVGGGEKMESLHKSKGMIYAQFEGESFQVLFAPEGVTTVPVRFEAKEDGVFTLNWHTLHGNFSYLHLIDNITGVDVDCLTANEYKFEGKTSDYRSRFKLVFRCEGDEPEDPEDPDTPEDEDPDHFAFIFGNELVVNGEGILQMFDIQGRCLMETQAIGSQSNHNLPRVSAGVYLLRLTGDKKVRVQKMVIK